MKCFWFYTGDPKGAMLTHRSVIANLAAIAFFSRVIWMFYCVLILCCVKF